MKKLIFSLILCLTGIFILTSGYAYARRCKKCQEHIEKYHNGVRGIAHRDFDRYVVRKDGKTYAWYVCEYGHEYLVDLDE